jgi:phosphoglycolate phosphatase
MWLNSFPITAAEVRYRLVVFDWDGTLSDSPGAIVDSMIEACRDLGIAAPDPGRARYTIGLGMVDALRHALPELEPSRYREYAASYHRHFVLREGRMGLFAGVRELLAALRQRGCLLAVATGKSRAGLGRALAHTGTGGCFDGTRCADETAAKPDPAMLHALLGDLDVRPQEALMVGDTTHDIRMATAAGVETLAVSYGAHREEALRTLQPRACVPSVQQLSLWLINHT